MVFSNFNNMLTCFFRINECLKLEMEDVTLERDNENIAFVQIKLWDSNTATGKVEIYDIYNNSNEPAINSFYFLCEHIYQNRKIYFIGRLSHNKLRCYTFF